MPYDHPFIYVVIAFLLIGIAVVFILYKRRAAINSRYGITMSGGRAGILEYRSGDQQARIGWEGSGGKFHIVVFTHDLVWRSPSKRVFTEADRQTFFAVLRSWAAAHGYRYILFPDDTPDKSTVA